MFTTVRTRVRLHWRGYHPLAVRLLAIALAAAVIFVAACAPDSARHGATDRAELTGRAILPADTFAPGPVVGRALADTVNGRATPFASPPVQGFSSLVVLPGDGYLALMDNGFGTLANSGDYPLRWFRLHVDLDHGRVDVIGVVDIADPQRRLPFPIVQPAGPRVLTGGDFDPESWVRLDDGTFWIGEEFGPFLLHVDGDGTLLTEPIRIPVVDELCGFARGLTDFRSPDHPDLRGLPQDEDKIAGANLPRSGGIEGLARSADGTIIYVAVEKALLDDPERRRRTILAFDPVRSEFTGRYWYHRVDEPGLSIASLEVCSDGGLLVVERDSEEGESARFKRIYRVDLDRTDADGYLSKQLVCDLLDIADPHGFTRSEPGAVGLGPDYTFPYVTPECLVVLDAQTLLVCNDNNYPFSTGRRPGVPDDSEFIRLRLARALR